MTKADLVQEISKQTGIDRNGVSPTFCTKVTLR